MEIRVWRFQNYRDCRYTCNPHKFEIPAPRFPCRVPAIPCKHLQCRRHFQIFSCTLKSTTGNCLKYLPKSNMVKINLLLNNQVNLLCEHNVFVLNNDENLAIFSNNMHNLCRLNYFFKSWVLNFQSCFFCLA